jgi:hypothetical protein
MKEKRKTIKFNVIDYRKGNHNVITNDGNRVIILTTNAPGNFPIQGSIEYSNGSEVCSWKLDGTPSGSNNSNLTLKLREKFKEGDVINIYNYNEINPIGICIFKNIKDDKTIRCYALKYNNSISKITCELEVDSRYNYMELADKNTKDKFLNDLLKKEQGLVWNTSKKSVVSPYKLGDIIVLVDSNNKAINISVYRGIIYEKVCEFERTSFFSDIYINLVSKNIKMNTLIINDIVKPLGELYRTRLATKDEIQEFISFINREGLSWNTSDGTTEFPLVIGNKYLMKNKGCIWSENILSCKKKIDGNDVFISGKCLYEYCIPLTEETKSLIGTSEDCPIKYKPWKERNMNYFK